MKDEGETIRAAVADLPSTGGIVDARPKKRNFFSSGKPKQSDRTRELHAKLDTILKDPKYGEIFGKVVTEVFDRMRTQKLAK